MILTERTITRADLAQIEKYADKLFAKVGIDVGLLGISWACE